MPKILDASAVLALIRAEPGYEIVAACLERGARACTINLSEGMAVLVRKGMSIDHAANLIGALSIDDIDFDSDLARRTASLVAFTKPFGLSFADRACLACGQKYGDPVVTADRRWSQVGPLLGAAVELIRS